MVEDATRCLSTGIADSCARLNVECGLLRHLILLNDTQCLIECIEEFHTAHNDALERISTLLPKSCSMTCFLRQGRELVKVQVVACQRPGQVGSSLLHPRMQRIGMSNMFLDEVVVILLDGNV